jgi:hypothetical protein
MVTALEKFRAASAQREKEHEQKRKEMEEDIRRKR